jgi:hypothetical protein
MKKDGDLRSIFRTKLRHWHWSTIETGVIAPGTPDSEFFTTEGVQGWIEFKWTNIFYVQIKPLQVAWLMRRSRMGGNAWIAVRRTPQSQKELGSDELWIIAGHQAENLFRGGLKNIHALYWEGGPANWNFEEIIRTLNLK